VSGQLHAPAALPSGKSPRYPFYRRLGGPQGRSGRYGEVKILYPTGTRTPAPPGRPRVSQARRQHEEGSSLCLVSSLTLKMGTICFSETSVDFHRTTWPYIPEDRTLRNHRCENLKSYREFQIPAQGLGIMAWAVTRLRQGPKS
jgi:hypothetical protein